MIRQKSPPPYAFALTYDGAPDRIWHDELNASDIPEAVEALGYVIAVGNRVTPLLPHEARFSVVFAAMGLRALRRRRAGAVRLARSCNPGLCAPDKLTKDGRKPTRVDVPTRFISRYESNADAVGYCFSETFNQV